MASTDQSTRDRLKRDCIHLHREIRELSNQLRETRRPRLVDPENPELSLRRARERRLVAEIETIKQTPPQPLENDRNVLYQLLELDLVESIQELEICLTCVRSEERKLVQDIERLEKDGRHHAETDVSLSQKLQVALGKEEASEESIVSDLKRKTKRARAESTKLLTDMAQFVNEHFPAPRPRNLSGPREANDDEDEPHRYDPMLSLVESLMNKCVDSPHDPYIQLDDKYWKPHVEHLLRFNIALRHPEDGNRIKLVPFHV